MTSASDTRKSKHGLNTMAVGEVRTFDTPTERDKDILRRSAHNQNERTERFSHDTLEGRRDDSHSAALTDNKKPAAE